MKKPKEKRTPFIFILKLEFIGIEPKRRCYKGDIYTTGRVQQYRKVRSAVKNRIPGLGLYGNGYGNMAENEKTYACC